MAENDRHDEQLNDAATGTAHHSHEEDLQATRRIARESDNEPEPDGEAGQPEKRCLLDNFRRAYSQARDGRKARATTQEQDRSTKGRDVVVLFSVLNVQDHTVELMPPQIQLAGKINKGAIVKHKVWSNSEQLSVEAFRMSRRRLGPGERADGVLVFERPSFKQSNETVLLQMADSGAVDRPALAPIGFGISTFRKDGGE